MTRALQTIGVVVVLALASAALADHDIDVPYECPEGTATIDGDLSDWAGATWIPMDEIYSAGTGFVNDITDAKYALRWSSTTNLVYVAASVTDTVHNFEDYYTTWSGQDDIELYLDAGENNTTTGMYGTYQDVAQQMSLGYHPDGDWAVFGDGTKAWTPEICPEYAAVLDGDGQTILYEASFVPHSYYTGFGGAAQPEDVIVDLTEGITIGFDAVLLTVESTPVYGMLCNNTIGGKFKWSATMQTWELVAGGPNCDQPGDADEDGDVDLDDFVVLKTNWGGPGGDCTVGDFNASNSVDLDDFVILKNNWGAGAVPEPASMGLLALGGLALVRRRSR